MPCPYSAGANVSTPGIRLHTWTTRRGSVIAIHSRGWQANAQNRISEQRYSMRKTDDRY